MIKLKDLLTEGKYEVYFDVGSPGLMSKTVDAKNAKEAAKKVASGLKGGAKLIKKVENLNKDLKNAKTIAAKAKRLYKGLPVKILKNAPTSGVTLMLYGAVMRALGGKNQKNKDK